MQSRDNSCHAVESRSGTGGSRAMSDLGYGDIGGVEYLNNVTQSQQYYGEIFHPVLSVSLLGRRVYCEISIKQVRGLRLMFKVEGGM